MGKYVMKSKGKRGASILEVNHAQGSLGVCTRSKTLALQRAQMLSPSARPAVEDCVGGGNYLQLRSRRLERLPPIVDKGKPKKKRKSKGKELANDKEEAKEKLDKGKKLEENENEQKNNFGDMEVDQGSSGENVVEFENNERATRETTPCNPIPEPITPPASRTRHPSSSIITVNIISHEIYPIQFYIPPTDEMKMLNEFFVGSEEKEHKKFIEKYNFDPVKDEPLPGRFEWEKLKP